MNTITTAIKTSFLMVWRHGNLWLLGLLSVIFAGSFGLSNFFSQLIAICATNKISWLNGLTFISLPFGDNFLLTLIYLILLVLIIIAISIAVIYISIIAKAALLTAVSHFYKKNTVPKLTEIWNKGLKRFWPLFTIEIVKKIALFILVCLFGLIWIWLPFETSPLFLVIDILVLTLVILVGWTVNALAIFAGGYTIIDGKSLVISLKKSWRLLHAHLLAALEISIILSLIDLLVIGLFAAFISYAFLPSVFVWLLAGVFGSGNLAIIGALVNLIVLILGTAIFGALYNTFYTGAWMYLFMKMHHEGIASRIVHHMTKLFWK